MRMIKKQILFIGSMVLAIIIVTFVANGFVPFHKLHYSCFENIAQVECGDRDTYLNINTPTAMGFTFSCCETKNVTSRKVYEQYPPCEKYIFLEKDIRKCSDKFYWFGLKRVD